MLDPYPPVFAAFFDLQDFHWQLAFVCTKQDEQKRAQNNVKKKCSCVLAKRIACVHHQQFPWNTELEKGLN